MIFACVGIHGLQVMQNLCKLIFNQSGWLINKSEEYIFFLVIWNRSEINIRIFLLKEVDSIIHTHLFRA